MKALNRINFGDVFHNFNFIKAALFLAVIGIVIYANAIPHPFVHDDIVFILQNPNIADLEDWQSIFLQPAWPNTQIRSLNPYYRPLLEVVYRLEYKAFEFNPYGYHLVNVILHILNSILVFKLFDLLFKRKGLSLGLATIFLVHPVQSQAVASIAGISNLLFVFFMLISFVLYAKSNEESNKFSRMGIYVSSLVAFGCALLSKEQAIVLPALILFYEFCMEKEHQKSWVIKALLISGFVIVAGTYWMFRESLGLGGVLGSLWLYRGELWLRILAIPRTLFVYWGILLFPRDLHYYRSIDVLDPVGASIVGIVIVVALFVVLTRLASLETARLSIFSAVWFFVTLLPTLNITPLIIEYSIISAAEHFLYLPMVGFFLLVFGIVDHFVVVFKKSHRETLVRLLIIVSIVLGLLTIKQNNFWRSEVALFERAIKYEKKIARVYLLYGRAKYFEKDFDEAIRAYEEAMVIMQRYIRDAQVEKARLFYISFLKEIYFDLSHCYEAKQDYVKAIEYLKQILVLSPAESIVYNNIGSNYLRMDRTQDAQSYFEKAIEINPAEVRAMNNLAICYIHNGKKRKARKLLKEVLDIDPHFISARQNIERLDSEINDSR